MKRPLTLLLVACIAVPQSSCSTACNLAGGVRNDWFDLYGWHDISLRCETSDKGPMQFKLASRGVYAVLQCLCWSDSKAEPLWAFVTDLELKDMQTMTYGVLPQESSPALRKARQIFPRNGQSRPIEPGERFTIMLTYEYDTLFSVTPCTSDKCFSFEAQDDHSVKALARPAELGLKLPPKVAKVAEELCAPPPAE
jgi:hypothetical protein